MNDGVKARMIKPAKIAFEVAFNENQAQASGRAADWGAKNTTAPVRQHSEWPCAQGSDAVLQMVFQHIENPEFQCRL
jgi:hypothetical protein